MKKLRKIFPLVIGGLIGVLGGLLSGDVLVSFIREIGVWGIALILVSLIIFYNLHIILHEAGHLLMGKLSGYSFVSFRVYSLMIVRQNGKLVRKKFNVVGTAGQCLMSPPEMKDGTFPLVLYNFGGVLMNFLFSGLCFWLFWLLPSPWSAVFLVSMILGVFIGLTNIIPLKIGGVPNDGYNLFRLRSKKNTATRHGLWVILRANALLASGVRARDFPSAWFDGLDLDHLSDPMVAGIAAMKYNYLLDQGAFEEARALAQTLLDTPRLLELYKNEMRCELLFFELIFECRKAEIEGLYTKELAAYIKATFSYASRQRLLFAYALLFLQDAVLAAEHLDLFQKACAKSASLGEIPGEQELVAYVYEVADRRADEAAAV